MTVSNQVKNVAEASLVIGWNIARAINKKNLEVLDPNNAVLHKHVSQILISRHTTEQCITTINTSLEYNFKKSFEELYCIQLSP